MIAGHDQHRILIEAFTMNTNTRLLLASLAFSLISAAAAAADTSLLLAINKGDNTLAVVDAATGKVLGKAPTGPDPHEVVASPDGKLAFITNYNAGNGVDNTISVVDLEGRRALPPLRARDRKAIASAGIYRDCSTAGFARGHFL